MNIRNMARLALFLETLPERKFNMKWWVSSGRGEDFRILARNQLGECGTAACVAGWAVVIEYPNKKERDQKILDRSIMNLAGDFLGLTYDERDYLFSGRWTSSRCAIEASTPAEAAVVTWKMIEFGGIPKI